MPKQHRIHVPGGTYYIVRRTNAPYPVFSRPGDYEFIEGLLSGVLRRTGISLCGYCLLPDAIHLVLVVDAVPVGDLMREVTSKYTNHVHRQAGTRGEFFRRAYQSILIDPEMYLVMLMRYLHWLPVSAGWVASAAEYPYSSQLAYQCEWRHQWLDKNPVLRVIEKCATGDGLRATTVLERPPQSVCNLLERAIQEERILGDGYFLERVPRRIRSYRSKWTLEDLVAHVMRTRGPCLAQLRSRSRRHELVLARAQIAWYATERRIATLNEVGRYLNRSASSLGRAIQSSWIRVRGRLIRASDQLDKTYMNS